jgi:hypothetical protein
MSSHYNENFLDIDRGGTRFNPGISRHLHTQNELATIDTLSLSTTNLLTDTTGRDVIVLNDGQLLYQGTIT